MLLAPVAPAIALGSVPPCVAIAESAGKGRGLFAARDLHESEVIFTELPLVGMQHLANAESIETCAMCMRHVGELEAQLARLMPDEVSAALVPLSMPCRDEGFRACPPAHRCRGGCSLAFCGAECEGRGWTEWHSLLCIPLADGSGAAMSDEAEAALPAPDPARLARLEAFHAHALECNEIFLLAARVCATAALAFARTGSWEVAWAPFAAFHQPLWWDAVAFSAEDVEGGSEEAAREQMREVLAESWALLRAALCAGAPALEALPLFTTPELYARVVGLFERNNCSMLVASPVEDYFLHIDGLSDGPVKAAVEAVSAPVLDALGEDYAMPAEGAGIFWLQAVLNHACVPNVSFVKRDEDVDGRVVLTAGRHIRAGEELVHSYIDEGQPLDTRTEELRNYGFVCDCQLCAIERASAAGGSADHAQGRRAAGRKLK
ncbi:hypothetical protein T492DRAFT_979073 [Pavlovales sp. CCMP2436]|nr:hypothetical protein T492DRAFT_979073 [Pavlovales sp. CCMP2436]|mmetsp:Transcript_3213/g.7954  ORF Transcript_3213/g.7954 Transcript_3213/m.7954 type:complete len:435 (-) Transcript_3213:60-1364(-)